MHNGMKNSMKRVFWILAILFILVLGTMFKLVACERQVIAANSYNSRLGYGNEDFKRGSIYDSDGNVMAESVKNGEVYDRVYPYGKAAAHITGYTGAGAAGIEAVENFSLLGLDNEISQRVNNIIKGAELTGDDVYLTIDMDIQQLAYDLLGKSRGAAVVMDPVTGSVIAMASTPSYDPNTVRNDWSRLSQDENSPLLNRATQGLYPPGSTFKIVTALDVIRNIPDYEDFSFNCNGEVTLGKKTIHCFDSKAHGMIDIDEAMAQSCNSAFATLGDKTGGAKLRKTADSLKINDEINFDLPVSQSIVSLTRMSDESELAETSIGQGKTLVTPLYMSMLISSVANSGVMMQPYMVEKITYGDGSVKSTTIPKVYDRVMTEDESERLTEMLKGVINRGTGRAAQLNGWQAAGKTGTAENAGEYDHSWFVGFAPADDPKVAVAVILENVSGSERATPIAGKLMQAVLDKNTDGSFSREDYISIKKTYSDPEPEIEIRDEEPEIIENEQPDNSYIIGSDINDYFPDRMNNFDENIPADGSSAARGEHPDELIIELDIVDK